MNNQLCITYIAYAIKSGVNIHWIFEILPIQCDIVTFFFFVLFSTHMVQYIFGILYIL